jgi:hypothetical protein
MTIHKKSSKNHPRTIFMKLRMCVYGGGGGGSGGDGGGVDGDGYVDGGGWL